jgi:hypothetical protein
MQPLGLAEGATLPFTQQPLGHPYPSSLQKGGGALLHTGLMGSTLWQLGARRTTLWKKTLHIEPTLGASW